MKIKQGKTAEEAQAELDNTANKIEMMVKQLNDKVQDEICKHQHKYDEDQQTQTWVIRCYLDPESLKLKAIDKHHQSILFRNEACLAICEYAPNKMIIYGQPSHNLFLLTDW